MGSLGKNRRTRIGIIEIEGKKGMKIIMHTIGKDKDMDIDSPHRNQIETNGKEEIIIQTQTVAGYMRT